MTPLSTMNSQSDHAIKAIRHGLRGGLSLFPSISTESVTNSWDVRFWNFRGRSWRAARGSRGIVPDIVTGACGALSGSRGAVAISCDRTCHRRHPHLRDDPRRIFRLLSLASSLLASHPLSSSVRCPLEESPAENYFRRKAARKTLVSAAYESRNYYFSYYFSVS